MIKLQRVLLIDDEYEQVERTITDAFQGSGIDIRFCATKDEAIDLVNSGIHFDLVILDWFLEEENNLLSRLVLKHLQETVFLPVFIWSNHIANYTESLESGETNYPFIEGIAKDQVTGELIQEKVSSWFESSLTAQISNLYRQQIRKGIEKVFFDLAKVPNQDLASLLKFLVGDGITVDWSHDFILNLLHRQLIGENDFCERLRALLRTTESIKDKGSPEDRKAVLNKVLYYTTDAQFVRCGDIVQFQMNSDELKFGIVVTPACDLAQGATRFLELIELRRFDDKNLALNSSTRKNIKRFNEPSWYLLPSISMSSGLTDLVAIFKSKITLEQSLSENLAKHPKTSRRMEYSDNFLFQKHQTTLKFICGLDYPYKSDLLQKMNAHNSRVGIPDIRRLLE